MFSFRSAGTSPLPLLEYQDLEIDVDADAELGFHESTVFVYTTWCLGGELVLCLFLISTLYTSSFLYRQPECADVLVKSYIVLQAFIPILVTSGRHFQN